MNDQHLTCKPLIYKRYVDDIFAVFETPAARDTFYDILNKAHPNLSFTMEITTNKLPFLDVSISIKDNSYNTEVYRKPTNTGILMNFDCMAPRKWKKALIKCLLTRAYRVSSDSRCLDTEINNIKDCLQKNDYPRPFINKVYEEFLKSRNTKDGSIEEQEQN